MGSTQNQIVLKIFYENYEKYFKVCYMQHDRT